jgi:hypothetical protein
VRTAIAAGAAGGGWVLPQPATTAVAATHAVARLRREYAARAVAPNWMLVGFCMSELA